MVEWLCAVWRVMVDRGVTKEDKQQQTYGSSLDCYKRLDSTTTVLPNREQERKEEGRGEVRIGRGYDMWGGV